MKESRKRTECVYVRPEHKDKVRRYVLKLESYDEREKLSQEERKRKKKNQKEIKKKEERTTTTTNKMREALQFSFLNKTIEELRPTEEQVSEYIKTKNYHITFKLERWFDYYDRKNWMVNGIPVNWQEAIDTWVNNSAKDIKRAFYEQKSLKSEAAQKKAAEKIYHPEEEQVKVYRPRDQYNSYPVYES